MRQPPPYAKRIRSESPSIATVVDYLKNIQDIATRVAGQIAARDGVRSRRTAKRLIDRRDDIADISRLVAVDVPRCSDDNGIADVPVWNRSRLAEESD